jgi:HTH-type transcriptional regulator/antitoxin HigA
MTISHRLNLPADAPESYEELVRLYLPRKIHDRVAYENAVEVIRWLAVRAENNDQIEFLDLVSNFVHEYEVPLRTDPPASPLELLNFLVEENKVTTRELGALLGIDHSAAARILKGQRSITPEHAKKLGEHFAIRPSRFLGLE